MKWRGWEVIYSPCMELRPRKGMPCVEGGRWSKQGYGVLWKVYMVMSKGYGVARGLR